MMVTMFGHARAVSESRIFKMAEIQRREVQTRNKNWSKKIASTLAGNNVSPNIISLSSIVFALVCIILLNKYRISWIIEVAAIACILGRLLCNVLDGMVAVEYNRASKVGELYNDLPDRISDTLILLGLGLHSNSEYSVHLAWVVCFMAFLTAYIRQLGATITHVQFYNGPMAKQHRMFVSIVILALELIQNLFFSERKVDFLMIGLVVIGFGSLITCIRRLILIANKCEAQH